MRPIAIASWPAGIALTSWSYVWRTTPIHRREQAGSRDEDLPPALPPTISTERLQRPAQGCGPLFHRTYSAQIIDSRLSAEELMAKLQGDPNFVAPVAFARFHKTTGPAWRMEVGDEFIVRMPGPWDGPVRTVAKTPTSFRFATLERHLEAGQIEWRAREEDGLLLFQVESWARAGDRASALLHDRLRMAKEVQLHMWTSVVEKVVTRTRGRLLGGIDIDTHRVDGDAFAQP
jgi:hypothetical protein